jgi:hypothetical protein
MPRSTVGTETSARIDIDYEDRGFGQSVALIHVLHFYNVNVLGGTRISERARS